MESALSLLDDSLHVQATKKVRRARLLHRARVVERHRLRGRLCGEWVPPCLPDELSRAGIRNHEA